MAKKTSNNSNHPTDPSADISANDSVKRASSTTGSEPSDDQIEAELDAQLEMELESSQQEAFEDESLSAADVAADSVAPPSIEDELYKEALEDDGGEPKPAEFKDAADEQVLGRKKVQIDFPYSELIREKVPKVFEVAETVAEEWVNDGNFEKVLDTVPVAHPLAQITVAAGLRKAKEVEKKLEEKGVFAMARMGLEYAKAQLNDKLNKK